MKIGLFIDLSNMYHFSKREWNRKISYSKVLDFLAGLGTIEVARAYGTQVGNQSFAFQKALTKLGIEPVFKPTTIKAKDSRKGNVDVELAMDIVESLEQYDTLILASGDSDFLPVVEKALASGKRVILFTSEPSKVYRGKVSTLEIQEGFLE